MIPDFMLCASKESEVAHGWVYELKLDGIRAMAIVEDENLTLLNRNGEVITPYFPEIQIQPSQDCIIDGEICYRYGRKEDFQGIQQRTGLKDRFKAQIRAKTFPTTFFSFDLLELDGQSLCSHQYYNRKRQLAQVFDPAKKMNFQMLSAYENRDAIQEYAESHGYEGIIKKAISSLYHGGQRSNYWQKIKFKETADFYVIGFTAGTGWRSDTFGSLVLASKENGNFRYRGRVGTGFDQVLLKRITSKFVEGRKLIPNDLKRKDVRWVQPFKVEVEYLNLSKAGIVRQPAFKKVI